MKKDLYRLEQGIGHAFVDQSLLRLALTHRSASRKQNNERLEFLGDALLSQVISIALFNAHPRASEGQLTRMRSALVKGVTLADIGREFGIGDYLALGSGEMKSGGFRRESILADALEALIGAIYLDAGMPVCERTVLSWFAGRLQQVTPQSSHKDAKTALQEWLQGRQLALPDYDVLAVQGQAPAQTFEVVCRLAGVTETFSASAGSRRKAEQQAAALALAWLEQQDGSQS
mgnify:CR=1 FL=1